MKQVIHFQFERKQVGKLQIEASLAGFDASTMSNAGLHHKRYEASQFS